MTMDLFAGVIPFVHVAEERSFRKASEQLGLTTAAVSKSVAKLEAELGVTLLARSTRSVSLTAEGAAFLERAREAVLQMRAARDSVARATSVPEGVLRVTMPLIFARLFTAELARLSARHPRLTFQISFTDRITRVVEEQFDVAIRVGQLAASSLIARRLRRPRWVTVASPGYLGTAGTPKHVHDLTSHRCLHFGPPKGGVRAWTFASAGEDVAAATQVHAVFDHGEMLVETAVAGMGITQVLDLMVADHLRDGRLVELFEDQAAAGPPVHALYSARRMPTKVRVVLDAVDRVFG